MIFLRDAMNHLIRNFTVRCGLAPVLPQRRRVAPAYPLA